jgi:hypothetical protein
LLKHSPAPDHIGSMNSPHPAFSNPRVEILRPSVLTLVQALWHRDNPDVMPAALFAALGAVQDAFGITVEEATGGKTATA